jgi:opacity protein-like surface antigen
MKKLLVLISLITITCACTSFAFADQGVISSQSSATGSEVSYATAEVETGSSGRALEAIEFMSGYSWASLKNKDDYGFVPLIVGLDFNLKPLTKKFNFAPRSLLQFQIEPFIGAITSPESNMELGTSFFLKAGFLPQTSKFQPYVKAGVGMDYMTLHTNEQSTQFNFISTGAVGAHFFLKKNLAFTVEGRYRHLSNASIKDPNAGINSTTATAGILYQF